MSETITILRIERVEIAPAEGICVVVRQGDGNLLKLVMPARAAGYLGGPLLGAMAMSMAAPPKPKVGTVVASVHLPVLDWDVTTAGNGEPLLGLNVPGRNRLQFQLPRDLAHACGAALSSS